MKTQTDNSNIVMPESLEDAARTQYNNMGYDKNSDGQRALYVAGARLGANWQKEQLLPLITILEKISKGERYTLDEVNNALQLIKP